MTLSDDDTNIGNLLWRTLVVDKGQLARAVELQREKPDTRIGELLVEIGALTPAELSVALDIQRGLRGKPGSAESVKAADRLLAWSREREALAARSST